MLWRGFPKGAVSLMVNESGGATDLWLRAAAPVTRAGQWVAWINDQESELTPWALRRHKADMSKILCISPPGSDKRILWVMQELMSLCLFESIACDLGSVRLKDHHVLKLKKLAMRYQTAIILISHATAPRLSSFYSFILRFHKHRMTVLRALHRPTPFSLERRYLYADTLPQLAAGRRALCG
ncbi:MAG: hypothetical protein HC902_13790 [Calothrix sp. SM1_5_4]|nr:hypothetical protein [Calothrix sp. SM1_5_4]